MPETKNIRRDIAVLDADAGRKPLSYRAYIRVQEGLRRERRELLMFCKHPPTLTAGVKSRDESLLLDPSLLAKEGIAHARIGRGGDYTAHEPGQCVIYPHVDLRERAIPVSKYFDSLLEITRASIREVWGIELENHPDAPGLYTTPAEGESRKLASIGIMFKGFFSSFGLAVNVNNSLKTFQFINPCGDADLNMTTVADAGGDPELLPEFKASWTRLFQDYLRDAPPEHSERQANAR